MTQLHHSLDLRVEVGRIFLLDYRSPRHKQNKSVLPQPGKGSVELAQHPMVQ
jgi:hypothetical protein